MSESWFVRAGGKLHGPFDSTAVRRLAADGKLTPVMELSNAQGGPWTRAGTVAGLFPAEAARPSPPATNARSSAAPPALPTESLLFNNKESREGHVTKTYQVVMRKKMFSRSPLQSGWIQAAIGKSGLLLTGKPTPSIGKFFLFGMWAFILARRKTITLAYRDVISVSLNGNAVTLTVAYENKKNVLIMKPFSEKGFFGGKGPLGKDFNTRLQAEVAAARSTGLPQPSL